MNEFRYIIGILLASEINDFKTLKLMNESINEYDVSLAIKILGLNGIKIKNYIKYDQKSLYKVDNDFQKLLKRRGYYE
jgi:5'(3')-deoxyribonucleotidase